MEQVAQAYQSLFLLKIILIIKIIKNIYFIDDNENVLKKKIYKWFSYNRLQSI